MTETNTALKEEKNQDRLAPDPTKLREKLERAFSIGKEGWSANTSVPRTSDDSTHTPSDTSEQSAQQETKPEEDLERAEKALNAIEYPFQDGRTGKDNRDTHPTAVQRSITSPGPIALSKVAVIHIDGNGIGAIMRNLKAAVGCVPPEEFEDQLGCEPRESDALRRFVLTVSLRLDAVVADAFATAWYDVAQWARKDRCADRSTSPSFLSCPSSWAATTSPSSHPATTPCPLLPPSCSTSRRRRPPTHSSSTSTQSARSATRRASPIPPP